jgi:hypothetical protein
MKSHILLALSLMVAHATVSANGTLDPPPQTTTNTSSQAQGVGIGVGVGIGAAEAVSGSTSDSAASATQTQAQDQSQTQNASAEANNSGLSQAVALNYKGVRNAPSVALGAGFPTAGCQGVAGIGGSGVNGSGLFNFSFTKKECETVVLAQNFAALDMPDVSCEILKTTKAWQRAVEKNPALEANCAPLTKEETALPISITPIHPDMSIYATKEDLDRAFKRSLSK